MINEKELVKKIKAARLIDCADPEATVLEIIKNMQRMNPHPTEYEAKAKELEDAIARCEQAEEEFEKRTCKFRSPTNCGFCAFHSDCAEHWKEGEQK